MQSIAETAPNIARDTVYILQRISQDFLVIYSCTVRGIVYLNIDKAYSLSFSLLVGKVTRRETHGETRHNKAGGACAKLVQPLVFPSTPIYSRV